MAETSPITLIVVDELAELTGFDYAAAFNAESSRRQQAVGVDPTQCLRVVTEPGNERTLLVSFFTHLKRGEWSSPETGEWQVHDEVDHWPGVRETHPKYVPVIMWAAAIGEGLLQDGKTSEAEHIADKIDYFVDKASTTALYKNLLSACGIDIHTVQDDLLFDTDNDHRKLIRAVEP